MNITEINLTSQDPPTTNDFPVSPNEFTLSPQELSLAPNQPTISTNQLPLSPSEVDTVKETFNQQNLQKKKSYLHALQVHNHQLLSKIKQLDKTVSVEVQNLGKKLIPSKKRHSIPKLHHLQTTELTKKFQQLNKLRQKLEIKRNSIDSLEFLLVAHHQQEITLKSLHQQIAKLKSQISSLQKIKTKYHTQQHAIHKEILRVGQFDFFENEIDDLRKKVQQKSEEIKTKKDEVLHLYNKNRSNKSVIAQPLPKEESTEMDPQLAQLKNKYLQMGKRIQTLKAKKASLVKSTPTAFDLLKTLQKVKQKYSSLCKSSKRLLPQLNPIEQSA